MNYHVLTLFPEMIEGALRTSITGRAMDKGILSLDAVNIRDFAEEKRKSRIDDYPYGGGAGMVMQAEPVYRAWRSVMDRIGPEDTADSWKDKDSAVGPEDTTDGRESAAAGQAQGQVRVLYMTPQGRRFDQKMAEELAAEKDLIFLCGHYEGIDERVLEEIVTDEVSIGDYVLTGGELPALVMMDTISRLVPGVLSNDDSAVTESFQGDGLLEYPQYSRPEVWHDRAVPAILLSGNHGAVDRWRRDRALERTALRRPDLCSRAELDKKDRKFLRESGLDIYYPQC
jgi:tRNA (guanine37-N1)-methyltransferase